MKGPTGTLEEEHHYIRMVVGTMAVFAERLQAGQDVPVEMLQQIIDFMRIFGDKCHHTRPRLVNPASALYPCADTVPAR